MFYPERFHKQSEIISGVLEKAPHIDMSYRLPAEEFKARQKRVWEMLQQEGYDCGVVYSDEHYCGDVPYLAGNPNIIVEPIAAVLGEKGLFFIAGLESGIVAEQYCHRSGVVIRKLNILATDSPGPADLPTVKSIVAEACGRTPARIALLTSRGVFPLGLYNALAGIADTRDISEKYYEIKYEKSDLEMRLIEEACILSDVLLEGMLRVLRPGITENEVAAWGYYIAGALDIDSMGFPIMVTSGENNKTIVGRPSNRVIREGDIVSIGVSPKRDGLCGAQRISVACVRRPDDVPASYKLWMDFLEGAYRCAVDTFRTIARENLPGCRHEQAMIAYSEEKRPEMEQRSGLSLPDFAQLKGYVTTHNSGYTECQEFYGALSRDFDRPLANQMVMMLDAGLTGYLGSWGNEQIPGLGYIVIEKTTGKFGKDIRVLNRLPINLQYLVGRGFDT